MTVRIVSSELMVRRAIVDLNKAATSGMVHDTVDSIRNQWKWTFLFLVCILVWSVLS